MDFLLAFVAGAALVALVLVLAGRPTRDRTPAVDGSALGELRMAVDQFARDQSDRTGSLGGKLDAIMQTQSQVAQDTSKLSEALRRPGVRGQWGEVTLRNVVECAGLAHHVDFDTQAHMRGQADDPAIRPDLVVRLPGGGAVPVDAKVPLDGFLDAVDAETPDTRDAALERHVRAVRAKVGELAGKAYWERFKRAPEMVVMFVASEAAFAAAAETDAELLEDAARKRVAIATPATMVALLQVVALGWHEEALSENAERVGELANELVKRLEILTRHFSDVGNALERAAQAHNSAVGSYESRLLVTARELADLGIAGARELSEPTKTKSATRQPAGEVPGAPEERELPAGEPPAE